MQRHGFSNLFCKTYTSPTQSFSLLKNHSIISLTNPETDDFPPPLGFHIDPYFQRHHANRFSRLLAPPALKLPSLASVPGLKLTRLGFTWVLPPIRFSFVDLEPFRVRPPPWWR